MQDEINVLKQAREKAEGNVTELKDKLREEILKSQGLQAKLQTAEQPSTHRSNARERYQDDTVDKAKYDELLGAVMGLELAADPLSEMNLSLQQSFIDELEQATGHLEDQRRLINAKVEQQEQQIRSLEERCDELKQQKNEILEIANRDNNTAQEIKGQLEATLGENQRLQQVIIDLEKNKLLLEEKEIEIDDVESVTIADNSSNTKK